MKTRTTFVILPILADLPSGAEMFFETNCQADACAGSIQRVHLRKKKYTKQNKKNPHFIFKALEWICGLAVLKNVTCLRQGKRKKSESKNCFCPIPAAWEANLTRQIMGLSLMVRKMHVRVKPIGNKSSINTANIPHPHPHILPPSSASGLS